MTYSNPAAYQQFMGRWSARLAPLFTQFTGIRDGQRILDVGCGTGSLSRTLLASGEAISVLGVDPTED
jgi:2-polyprenyl-3-methyl-5-hydroxy-6-metoxy-1,4-benzoquinol methylase